MSANSSPRVANTGSDIKVNSHNPQQSVPVEVLLLKLFAADLIWWGVKVLRGVVLSERTWEIASEIDCNASRTIVSSCTPATTASTRSKS